MDGNVIGLEGDGSARLANTTGIRVTGNDNIIGTKIPLNLQLNPASPSNVVSGNGTGIELKLGASGNKLQGNFVGTTVDGASGEGFTINTIGVSIRGSGGNTVGGADPTLRNVITNNRNTGISIRDEMANNNVVQGNFIGLTADGAKQFPSETGVFLGPGATGNLIGGATTATGNFIGGGKAVGTTGISLFAAGGMNKIQGNGIGGFQTGISVQGSAAGNEVGGQLPPGTPPGTPPGNSLINNKTDIDSNTRGTKIYGNRSGSATVAGIRIWGGGAQDAVVQNNLVTDAVGVGISVDGIATQALLTENEVSNVTGTGISLTSADGLTASTNQVHDITGRGVVVTSGVGLNLQDNVVTNNSDVDLTLSNATVSLTGGSGVADDVAQNGAQVTVNGYIRADGNFVQTGGQTTVNFKLQVGGTLDQQGGTLALAPASTTTANNYTLSSTATLNVTLGPSTTTPLTVTNAPSLNGQLILNLAAGFNPASAPSFKVIDNLSGSPVSGTFSGLPEGSVITAGGYSFRVSYVGTGNDVTLTPLASVGNYVWNDSNHNGIQDAGELPMQGVTVRLLSSTGTLLATTTTDGSGFYQFTGLAPGGYQLQFVAPTGKLFTLQDQGFNDALDSDANAAGYTAYFSLVGGQVKNDMDAGLYTL